MKYRTMIIKALEIATRAHSGATDKAGAPYITHSIRVMEKVKGRAAKVAAVLHDVVEDSDYRLEDLLSLGISPEVVDAVEALTHRKGEPYNDYIIRAGDNKISRAVKIEDLEDNMDLKRLPEITENDVVRLNKYMKAHRYLVGLL